MLKRIPRYLSALHLPLGLLCVKLKRIPCYLSALHLSPWACYVLCWGEVHAILVHSISPPGLVMCYVEEKSTLSYCSPSLPLGLLCDMLRRSPWYLIALHLSPSACYVLCWGEVQVILVFSISTPGIVMSYVEEKSHTISVLSISPPGLVMCNVEEKTMIS